MTSKHGLETAGAGGPSNAVSGRTGPEGCRGQGSGSKQVQLCLVPALEHIKRININVGEAGHLSSEEMSRHMISYLSSADGNDVPYEVIPENPPAPALATHAERGEGQGVPSLCTPPPMQKR
jgi:hypothetical protein